MLATMTTTARTGPSSKNPGSPVLRAVGLGWLALSALAIAVYAPLPYVLNPLRELAEYGNEIAANYAPRPGWVHVALGAHIAFGALALLLSPVQLVARVRARVPRLHRVAGRIVLASIVLGGTAGFVLSWFNVAGPVGTVGFGMLAVLWVTFAVLGLQAIRRGDVQTHRRWMLRAFALTYAAVTLRLWLIALIPVFGDFRTAYLLVPFLSWVPNLVVVELVLRRATRKQLV
jgi:uncharacterized membrane protein